MAHLHGVSVGSRQFYTPGCPTCEDKRARGLCGPEDPLQPETLTEVYHSRGQAPYGRDYWAIKSKLAQLQRKRGRVH